METSTLPVKGCKSLTYARHSWPLNGEGSLACITLCQTGVSVYNVHLRELMALTLIAERFAVELSQIVLTSYVCRGLDSNTQSSACEANVLTHGAIAAIAGCECAK